MSTEAVAVTLLERARDLVEAVRSKLDGQALGLPASEASEHGLAQDLLETARRLADGTWPDPREARILVRDCCLAAARCGVHPGSFDAVADAVRARGWSMDVTTPDDPPVDGRVVGGHFDAASFVRVGRIDRALIASSMGDRSRTCLNLEGEFDPDSELLIRMFASRIGPLAPIPVAVDGAIEAGYVFVAYPACLVVAAILGGLPWLASPLTHVVAFPSSLGLSWWLGRRSLHLDERGVFYRRRSTWWRMDWDEIDAAASAIATVEWGRGPYRGGRYETTVRFLSRTGEAHEVMIVDDTQTGPRTIPFLATLEGVLSFRRLGAELRKFRDGAELDCGALRMSHAGIKATAHGQDIIPWGLVSRYQTTPAALILHDGAGREIHSFGVGHLYRRPTVEFLLDNHGTVPWWV